MTSRPFALIAITPLALTVVAGCANEEEPPPEDQIAAEVAALTDPVEASLASPSGLVDASTVSGVFEAMASQGQAQGPMAFIPGASPAPAPQQTGQNECMDMGATGGTIDMACLTSGEITGTVRYSFATQSQSTAYMLVEYQNVCQESSCMDGEVAQKIITGKTPDEYHMVSAFDMTVTEGGQSYELQYGFEMSVVAGENTVSYVVWVDGESYVVSWTTNADGWQATITGDNGTYSCWATIEGDTFSGGCSGDGEFSF